MSNKSEGTKYEKEFAELLASKGMWVHLLAQDQNGQPADLIVVDGLRCALIDCKDCKGDRFLLSRIEENQEQAYKLWKEKTFFPYQVAIKMNGINYLVYLKDLLREREAGKKSVNQEWLARFGSKV